MISIRRLTMLFLMLALAGTASAQLYAGLDFSALARDAEETIEINLDGRMLRLASAFLSNDQADERQLREIVAGLKGIYVRSYSFDRDWQYDRGIALQIEKQIGRGWQKMVTVRSRTSENVDVFIKPGDTALDGLIIIAAEPREFTVVNIIGSIDIEKLSRLEGQFGIPEIDIEVGDATARGTRR